MRYSIRTIASLAALALAIPALAAEPAVTPVVAGGVPEAAKATTEHYFTPQSALSSGSVTVGGKTIAYRAEAGTIVVHAGGWDDTAWRERVAAGKAGDAGSTPAEASMFFTAYTRDAGGKDGAGNAAGDPARPVVFLFNGGPGSATVWLHMGAFGPRRVVTSTDSHTPAAPYALVNNEASLLDVADLVFIDAPGAGLSRIAGTGKDKAFYGVDADAAAFTGFIRNWLTTHHRWNSAKFVLGESYGTTRAAVLANKLQSDASIDLNGVVLLSQILDFTLSADDPEGSPGDDMAYVVALPTFAATAWYHHRLPGEAPAKVEPFLAEVEHFATTEYAAALIEGGALAPARRQALADKLAHYTGVPADYWLKSNLRLNVGQFQQQLQLGAGLATGRLDTRFSGPLLDPLAREAGYDPLDVAIEPAYVAAFNGYLADTLHFAATTPFRTFAPIEHWDWAHRRPDGDPHDARATNVAPDLAVAMKRNPALKVLVAGGWFDLATPYFEGHYEMAHLPVPETLRANIGFVGLPAGHMVYLHDASRRAFHDAVAAFITANTHASTN